MNSKQQNDERADERELRPALRPVEAAKLPPGRQILQYYWWQDEFQAGTALLWREQVAQKRRGLLHGKDAPRPRSSDDEGSAAPRAARLG